ncbi:MAG: phosphoenolpyruvate carboxykinase (ATP), partial [Gemmatimonadota bacterium]
MTRPDLDLEALGIRGQPTTYHNLSTPELVEHAIVRGEGQLVFSGALRTSTGERTGRSPNAKFTVDEPGVSDEIWWGEVNRPFDPEAFERMHEKVAAHLSDRTLYVFDGFAGADSRYRLGVRIINELAWHNLFVHQLFLRPTAEEMEDHEPEFTILHAPTLRADPEADGTGGEVFVLV